MAKQSLQLYLKNALTSRDCSSRIGFMKYFNTAIVIVIIVIVIVKLPQCENSSARVQQKQVFSVIVNGERQYSSLEHGSAENV